MSNTDLRVCPEFKNNSDGILQVNFVSSIDKVVAHE